MTEHLLPSIDMKPDVDRVDDQLRSNTCVAHAGSSALELCFKRAGRPTDFSRAFLYHNLFKFSKAMGVMDGAQPGGMPTALESGVCLESTMPYLDYDYEPSAEAIAEAATLLPKGSTGFLGCSDLHQIKIALNEGSPVMLTIRANNGLVNLSGDWRAHAWDYAEPMFGLHCVLCIGYDDASQRLLCENSWGPQWGDGGFFGIPYECVTGQSVVLDQYRFTRLPVPLVPMAGYVAAGIPEYADQILTIPTILFSPPAMGLPFNVYNVKVRVTGYDAVDVDSPKFAGNGGSYCIYKAFDDRIRLGLHKLLFNGVVYARVVVTNPVLELISVDTK